MDLWRRVQWRTPARLGILIPYVGLYFWAQMFLRWPLWDINRVAWACFLLLFVCNTALNLAGHRRAGPTEGSQGQGRGLSRRG